MSLEPKTGEKVQREAEAGLWRLTHPVELGGWEAAAAGRGLGARAEVREGRAVGVAVGREALAVVQVAGELQGHTHQCYRTEGVEWENIDSGEAEGVNYLLPEPGQGSGIQVLLLLVQVGERVLRRRRGEERVRANQVIEGE